MHHEGVKKFKNYLPILLIFLIVLNIALLRESILGYFSFSRAMDTFMGSVFLIFGFFKLMNWKDFLRSFSEYDIIAKKFRFYGYLYPLIEFFLGLAYVTGYDPMFTNIFTAALMLVSSISVVRAVFGKKEFVCACLGGAIKLPLSYLSFFESLLILVMASAQLFILK